MAINIAGDIMVIIANAGDISKVQGLFNTQQLFNTNNTINATPLNGAYEGNVQGTLRNRDTPFTAAQQQADARSALQQKRPVTFEFAQKKEDGQIKWRHIQLYINPEKISVSTQKIKGKAVARGGIFYNMYGDDHWQLQISGSTGLSGMKGIEQIEEMYHASGTLLRYQNYGPERMGIQGFEDYEAIDYKDPLDVINGIKNAPNSSVIDTIKDVLAKNAMGSFGLDAITNTASNSSIAEVRKKMQDNGDAWNRTTDEAERKRLHDENLRLGQLIGAKFNSSGDWIFPDSPKVNDVLQATADMKNNPIMNNYIVQKVTEIEGLLKRWVVENKIYNRTDVYNQAIYFFRHSLNNVLESGTQTIIANDLTKGVMDNTDSQTKSKQVPDDMVNRIAQMGEQKKKALSAHFAELEQFYVREKRIRDQLKTTALASAEEEFGDVWRPRRVLCYFENRVFIGHFDAFNYRRVAQTPLIEYELRFTVERQIVGDM